MLTPEIAVELEVFKQIETYLRKYPNCKFRDISHHISWFFTSPHKGAGALARVQDWVMICRELKKTKLPKLHAEIKHKPEPELPKEELIAVLKQFTRFNQNWNEV